jgi:hypothetical protein
MNDGHPDRTIRLDSVRSVDEWKVQKSSYFFLAILGLSFWFFLGLPFRSHRETYTWLAGAQTESLAQQFAFGQSSTYRPLSQVVTRMGYRFLDPSTFPTSTFRQALLQVFIYGLFILAWWLIFSAAPYRRLFAVVALVGGGVFFSGYVHLFHIYGMFYVPIILTLGALLFLYRRGTLEKREAWFALIAIVLVLWHPFSTALFLAFYCGFYVETFSQRNKVRHVQAAIILLAAMTAILLLVAVFPREHQAAGNRFLGFLVSYQTNEVNRIASVIAFLLSQVVALSIVRSPRLRFAACILLTILSIVFAYKGVPLLLVWFGVALIKVLRQRCWSVACLLSAAILLPFGGGIGAPSYGLFAIIVSIYVTALAWPEAERALSFLTPRYVAATVAASAALLLTLRAGADVPVVSGFVNPLLAERERTYQLEDALAWLHRSDYCSYEINFTEKAGSPVDSAENVINRRNRPPSALEDVRTYWNGILRCHRSENSGDQSGTAIVTFGDPTRIADASSVLVIKGKYAGDAIVWVQKAHQP